MVRLLILSMAGALLKRYIFRRRTRLVREFTIRALTQKLRALARRSALLRSAARSGRALFPRSLSYSGQPALVPAVAPVHLEKKRSAGHSVCRQRSQMLAPGQ